MLTIIRPNYPMRDLSEAQTPQLQIERINGNKVHEIRKTSNVYAAAGLHS